MFYGHDITITVPTSVFGDGQHETTRFLLYYLNRYAKGKTVIDAGCGSGILSVFASKCGATVTAIDCEKTAIETAKANCLANSVDVNIIHANATDLEITADIVVANFARHEVLCLFPHIAEMAKEIIITTWYKEVPKDLLAKYEVIDSIEGIDYDCYVLRENK